MIFDLKHTNIYQAVKIAKAFPLRLVRLVNGLFLFIALALLIAFFSNQPVPYLSSSSQVLGLFLIILSLDVLGWIWLIFF